MCSSDLWLAPLGYNKNVFPRLGDGRHKVYGALQAGARIPGVPAFVQGGKGFLFVSEDGLTYSLSHVDLGAWFGSTLLIGARYADRVAWNAGTQLGKLDDSYQAGPVITVRVDDRLSVTAGAMRDWYGRNSLGTDEVYIAVGFQQNGPGPLQGFLGGHPRP